MPTLPQNLSSRPSLDHKQNRFKYQNVSADLRIPGLAPGSVPLIQAEQESYWPDRAFRFKEEERRRLARDGFLNPGAPLFPQDLDSYDSITNAFPPTAVGTNVEPSIRDASFSNQRLAGANPLVIERVTSTRDVENLAMRDGLGGVKFQAAIDEGRLFVCNYKSLSAFAGPGATLVGGVMPALGIGVDVPVFPCQKYLYAPIALFYWEGEFDESGGLRPLGIQLEQTSAAGVFSPPSADDSPETSPNNWEHAKSAVQIADAHAHEWDMHLIRTHFVAGAFAISSERHLHDDHPVLILLRPHLRYLLAVNSVGDELVDVGAIGDTLLALEHGRSMMLLEQSFNDYSFVSMADPVNEIESRNMLASQAPIPYPYRDDGLPVYSAIRKFVSDYLEIYYRDDRDVVGDFLLQNFVKEVCADDGGRLGEVTESGSQVSGLRELINLVSRIIWTSGPLHAAVNFSQWDYMCSPKNMPMSGYAQLPAAGNEPDLNNFISFYPQSTLAKYQASVMYTLGTYRLDMLGHYREKDFLDQDALEAIADFQCHLARIGAATFQRDNARSASYPYLIPWNIPNSTNV